jgi:hypothetical protein
VWVQVDLRNTGLAIAPSAYMLRHYVSWDVEALRSWVLEAKMHPGDVWKTVSTHSNDENLNHASKVRGTCARVCVCMNVCSCMCVCLLMMASEVRRTRMCVVSECACIRVHQTII